MSESQEPNVVEQVSSFVTKLDTDMLISYAIEYGTALIGALVIFFVGKWIAKRITKLTEKLMIKHEFDLTIVSFLSNILYAILFVVVVVAAISTLGVETTSLAAVIAAGGLAVGLALQGSLSNFAAGILVIAFRPFKVGDYVEAGGTAGVIEEVNIFTTHMRTPDNCAVIVPNAQITGGNIKNYNAKPTRRMDLVIGVGYGDDLKKTQQVLLDVIAQEPRLLKNPEPVVAVDTLGDSSVNFVVRPWVKTADYWPTRFDLMMAIKLRLDEENISIPFPQRDLHIIDSATIETRAAKSIANKVA